MLHYGPKLMGGIVSINLWARCLVPPRADFPLKHAGYVSRAQEIWGKQKIEGLKKKDWVDSPRYRVRRAWRDFTPSSHHREGLIKKLEVQRYIYLREVCPTFEGWGTQLDSNFDLDKILRYCDA
ncbi:hypothetical protein TNCV_1453891 [Trichonephila clavipes]|nr:hypothetical protein TNCV_1453891 [Trichonephila clavipes]